MSEKRDYYRILEVERSAEFDEIRKSFKRLAKQYHPDLNPGDHQAEECFKELVEANDVLSDPDKRRLYDQFGHAGPRQAGFQGFSGMGVEDLLQHVADVFGGFGFGGRGRRSEQGDDLQTQVTISFLEAARGCQKPVEVTRLVHCKTCSGSGAKPGTSPTRCAMCGGRGQVGTRQGFLTIASDCPQCRGRGQTVAHKCGDCRGGGVTRVSEMLSVNVPAGIDDGQTLRVPGRGMAGPSGGPAGHLYVTFQVQSDARFERHGDDLLTQVPVSYTQAALGGRVTVPTLEGDLEIDVEAGTQPGTLRVMRGRGMPNVHGRGSGDLAVRFTIAVPKALSDEERRLLEELQKVEQPVAAVAPEVSDAETPNAHQEQEADEGGFSFFRKRKKKR